MPFIYVVHEREFRLSNQDVWKIGFTNQTIPERLRGYPKNSLVVLFASVCDGRAAESFLKDTLDRTTGVINRQDIGREYYECSLATIVHAFQYVATPRIASPPFVEDTMTPIVEHYNVPLDIIQENEDILDENESNTEEALKESDEELAEDQEDLVQPSEGLDAYAATIAFIAEHDQELHDKTLPITDLFHMYSQWVDTQVLKTRTKTVTIGGFVSKLTKIYKAKITSLWRDDKHVAAIKMPALRSDLPLSESLDANKEGDTVNKEASQTKTMVAMTDDDIKKWLDMNIESCEKGFVWEKMLRDAYNRQMVSKEGWNYVPKARFLPILSSWIRNKPYISKGQFRVPDSDLRPRDVWQFCRLKTDSVVLPEVVSGSDEIRDDAQ